MSGLVRHGAVLAVLKLPGHGKPGRDVPARRLPAVRTGVLSDRMLARSVTSSPNRGSPDAKTAGA